MRLYGAIDLHSNNNLIDLLDERDKVVYERRLPNDLSLVLSELEPYRDELEVLAVESTYNWYWLVDGLQEAGYRVVLVNTAKVPVYEGLKSADDRSDARHLAHLLRLGVLPTGYIYPKKERAIRDLLRKRAQLVRHRTAHSLSIQNLWARNTGTKAGADISAGTEPDLNRRSAIESSQTVIGCLSREIDGLEEKVLEQVRPREDWKAIEEVPGIGKILGLTILLEMGEIGRFKKAGQFSSYCRCVGSEWTSNDKKKGQGNRRNGNKYLSWAFMEAANFAIRYYDPIKRFYQRKLKKTHRVVALKAVAHKLSKATYHVLRDKTEFDMKKAFG